MKARELEQWKGNLKAFFCVCVCRECAYSLQTTINRTISVVLMAVSEPEPELNEFFCIRSRLEPDTVHVSTEFVLFCSVGRVVSRITHTPH